MSSEAPAICVEDLGKCYQVFARPRDRLLQALVPVRRWAQEFWALTGVNLRVQAGETVGIIGRNGSGKSTLLQVICGTLPPTRGRVEVRGRAAALLELGAGFHRDFTGRENVYLNARILGLSREQTEARFEKIAAFADIGAFMEQPVKAYSSGMYVRLAFAVAASVDADILVIDEALAVGDAFFRAKCMRYLREFQDQGGTTLFVSHDSAAVLSLCKRAVWLEGGKVRQEGPAKEVCQAYFAEVVADVNRQRGGGEISRGGATAGDGAQVAEGDAMTMPVSPLRPGTEGIGERGAEVLGVDLRDEAGREVLRVTGPEQVRLRVHVRAQQTLSQPIVGFFVNDRLGQHLFGSNTVSLGSPAMNAGEERVVTFDFQMPLLKAGTYTITVAVSEGTPASHTRHHWVHEAWAIASEPGPTPGIGLVGIPVDAGEMRVRAEEQTVAAPGGGGA